MEDYLKHFGILGMKWGVRRYQNPDGTLTEEGKRRYGKDSDDSKPSKKVSEMTDEELSGAINRMRNEKAYKDLMRELYPEKVTLMDKIVDKVKNETIPNTVSKVISDTTAKFIDKYTTVKMDEALNSKYESLRLKQEAENASNRLNAANKSQLADLLEKGFIFPQREKSDKPVEYTREGRRWRDSRS